MFPNWPFNKTRQEYDIKTVFQKLDHDSNQWLMCVDLKMVKFSALPAKRLYKIYLGLICLWDSRA